MSDVLSRPPLLGAARSSRYGFIDTAEQECVAGVAFRPGGAAAFFTVPAHELRDADTPLEFLWDRGRVAELPGTAAGSPSPARWPGWMC